MNDALTRLVQHKLYTVLRDAEVELTPKTLSALARAIADVGRNSISQKKWMSEVSKSGSALIDEMAKSTGMGEEEAAKWRGKFLGITTT